MSKLSSNPTFSSLHAHLLTTRPPLLPPGRAHNPSLTAAISSLLLHPTLETSLHLLNLDLPSAHFLCRHMQSAPAFEGMYLHGILHRIEGDYDNARAWYSDVKESECYISVWGKEGCSWKDVKDKDDGISKLDRGQQFLNKVQEFKQKKVGRREELEEESRKELETVIEWCKKKFGTERMEDASKVWVQPNSEIRQMGEDQVSGASGRRKF